MSKNWESKEILRTTPSRTSENALLQERGKFVFINDLAWQTLFASPNSLENVNEKVEELNLTSILNYFHMYIDA